MLFGAASVTKTFTTALIMRMVEEGYLSLDDSIGPRLPVWARLPNINPAITIRQLLDHTHGLGEYTATGAYISPMVFTPNRLLTRADLVAMIGPPISTPGAQYTYGNTGFLLLGVIIEKIYNLPAEEMIRRIVFRTCGLTTTFFSYYDSIPPNLVQAHGWSAATNPSTDTNLRSRRAMFSGYNVAGGSLSTAKDLAQWGRMLFGGHYITPASLATIQTITPQSLTGSLYPYGLGCISFTFDQRTAWGHFGNISGCVSVIAYEPTCDVSIALLFNDDRLPNLRPLIVERMYNMIKQVICPVPLGPGTKLTVLEKPSFAPNPAHDATLLRFTSPSGTRQVTLTLFDATGRLAGTQELDSAKGLHEIKLTGLTAGAYHAQLQLVGTNGTTSASSRLVVMP